MDRVGFAWRTGVWTRSWKLAYVNRSAVSPSQFAGVPSTDRRADSRVAAIRGCFSVPTPASGGTDVDHYFICLELSLGQRPLSPFAHFMRGEWGGLVQVNAWDPPHFKHLSPISPRRQAGPGRGSMSSPLPGSLGVVSTGASAPSLRGLSQHLRGTRASKGKSWRTVDRPPKPHLRSVKGSRPGPRNSFVSMG